MTTQNPIEVARETLKQLTLRKLLPTPENFERVYHELTQTPQPTQGNTKLATLLLRALETLPHDNVQSKITLTRIRQVVDEARWELMPQLVIDLLQSNQQEQKLTQSWGALINGLLKSWDLRLPGLTQTSKQAMLERVLVNYGDSPQELNEKLVALLQNWGQPTLIDNALLSEAPAKPGQESVPEHGNDASWLSWQRALHFALKHGLEPRLTHFPELVDALEALLKDLNGLKDTEDLDAYIPRLRAFMIKLELQSQQEGRLVTGLTNILMLMLDNIAELNGNDQYLLGQIESLQAILGQERLSMQHIYQLEGSLKDVIRKQGQLKTSLDEATSSLRALLDSFISRLALMTDSTDEFHNKIESHSHRIKQSQNVEELSGIIGALMEDTSLMQLDLTRSRDELLSAKGQVEAAQGRIRELETALEVASTKVKEDQLTGAYNRRGLAEFFEREIARSERTNAPLSVALIDVDNFKQLNDRYGHLAGDDALKYLVDAIRRTLRPADIVARFGGEEFVVLMPDTDTGDAFATIQRLQRELTKTFFLANNDRLVITFSAGVARWHLGEQEADLLERADRAMYQAKINGKNRVFSAEEQPA